MLAWLLIEKFLGPCDREELPVIGLLGEKAVPQIEKGVPQEGNM